LPNTSNLDIGAEQGENMKSILAIGTFALALAGCAAQSKIVYAPLQPDMDGWKKFTLAQSKILLGVGDNGQPSAQSVPVDTYPNAVDRTFMFKEAGGALSIRSTSVTSMNYIDNTRLVSSVGFTATSHVAEVLSAAVALIPIALAASTSPPSSEIPTAFRADSIDPFTNGRLVDVPYGKLELNPGWTYTLTVGQRDLDVVPFATFRTAALAGSASTVFPGASCVAVTLTLKGKLVDPMGTTKAFEARYNLKIADPDAVQTIALPSEGKITMHAQCGYNIEDKGEHGIDTAALSKSVDLVKALIAKPKAQ
jgi:hypothetical protein